MADDDRRWLTVNEAARETRTSPRTIRRWVEKEAVTIRRIGPSKRLRIDRRSLGAEDDDTAR
jgi:excisionase family DNA binding protein